MARIPPLIKHRIKLTDCNLTDLDKSNVSKYLQERSSFQRKDPIEELESAFSQYIGRRFCIAVNSGTSALHLSLLALNISREQEVITTTHTCVSILNAISYVNGTATLIDCNYDVLKMDYNFNDNDILYKINNKSKAIIIPQMFGVPTELGSIIGKGIPIIEDGTLSLGSKYKDGSYVGSKGDISVFSLHSSKMMSASVGGIILTDNEKYYNNILNRLSYKITPKYSPTYNYKIGEINAVLAKSQLEQLESFIFERRKNASKISSNLAKYKGIKLPYIDKHHVYYRYLLELPQGRHPEIFVSMGLKHGIEFGRGVHPALHNYLHLPEIDFINSEKFQERILSVPVYPGLNKNKINYICDVLKIILDY